MTAAVVYSTLLGDCDTLKPAPRGFPCVCLTDNPRLADEPLGWTIQLVAPTSDPRRESRRLKCVAHELFPDQVTVWVDASFSFLNLAAALKDLGDAEMAGFEHPDRHTCYDEGAYDVTIGQAGAEIMEAQLAEYRRAGFAPTGLTAAGFLLRRPTPKVAAFNLLWNQHIERFTVNEQVSLDFCAWVLDLDIRRLRGTYTDNPYVLYAHKDHRRRRQAYRL